MFHLEICRHSSCSAEKARRTEIIPASKSKNNTTALKAGVSGRKHEAKQKDKAKNREVNTELNRR